MIVKILSAQVPMFWETIKYVAVKVDEIEESEMPDYLIDLLYALLNDKAQCWVSMDETRQLNALAITRIQEDKISKKRHLVIQLLYSWKMVDIDTWIKDSTPLVDFAKKEKCICVLASSRNSRIWEIVNAIGFREITRSFRLNL